VVDEAGVVSVTGDVVFTISSVVVSTRADVLVEAGEEVVVDNDTSDGQPRNSARRLMDGESSFWTG